MDSKIDRFLFWDVLSSVDCRTSMASRATLACINVSHCENIHSNCFPSLFLYVFALLILSQCLIKVTSDGRTHNRQDIRRKFLCFVPGLI